MNRERIRAHLIFEEGLNLKRHQVDGKDHIGYGFNLEDEWDQQLLDYLNVEHEDDIDELTQEEADYILDWWIETITSTISQRFGESFTKLSPLRQENLFSMRYQMGAGGLRKFRMMWDAIDKENWAEAGRQMLDSLWAREQSPKRAERIATTFIHDDEQYLELDTLWDASSGARIADKINNETILESLTDQELYDEMARRFLIQTNKGEENG